MGTDITERVEMGLLTEEEASHSKEFDDYLIGADSARTAIQGEVNSLVEIGRCEANVPRWINVNVLHRPETTHNKFRVAASLRFDPEPLDENRNLWPHLIK